MKKIESILAQGRPTKICELLESAPAGLFIEVGVYKGGFLRFLAQHFPRRKLFGFDTFEGLPSPGKFDNVHKRGDFGDTSFEEVSQHLSSFPNVKLIKGFYPDSDILPAVPQVAFAFVDVDLYGSTYRSIVHLAPRMVSGGRIYCDDAFLPSCEGATLACCRFAVETGNPPRLVSKEHLLYFEF